jgi:tripartite-type tricarboxylate transporter receptor subunit TctC
LIQRLLLAASLAVAALGPAGQASAYPTRPITLVVPFAAGGPSDSIGRLIGKSLSESLGQPVLVENVAGAGGTAGATRVAKAPADGHTLLIHHLALAAGHSLYKNLAYDTRAAFEPVGLVNYGPFVLISKKDLAPGNLAEMIAWLKANSGKIAMAHAGIGSGSHLCGIMLTQALGITVNYIPYRGTGPALNDVVGGQVDVLCDQTTNAVPQIEAKTVKAFAVTAPAPIAQLPGIPTMASALPGFELSVWHALYAPKGTPTDVVTKLNGALQKALTEPEITGRFAALGTLLFPADQRSPAALDRRLQGEIQTWAELARKAGLQPQ